MERLFTLQNQLVQFITAEETMDLRMRILRPLHPAEMCRYAEDNFESTFHLGVLEDGHVVCNGTFMQQPCAHSLLAAASLPYRLRGMATDENQRGRGLGRKIILFAEGVLRERKCDLLWFNARVSAEGFYRKLGYVAIEEIFDIDSIGAHKIMFKRF